MKITTYLTLDGTTREAFTFYKDVLGGTLEMMTFAQAPDAEQFPAEYRERIMHACLNLGDGVLMASDTLPGDTCGGGPYEGIKGMFGFSASDQRGRKRKAVRRTGRGRHGGHAAGEDILGRAFRHAHRPLRRVVDG